MRRTTVAGRIGLLALALMGALVAALPWAAQLTTCVDALDPNASYCSTGPVLGVVPSVFLTFIGGALAIWAAARAVRRPRR